jgi:predicted Zn finger-like uncharacterized protein
MIVSCPACETRFQVDRDQLGYDGRIVRCAKCGNCWHQMPEENLRAAFAEGEVADSAVPPPPRRRTTPLSHKKKGGGLAVGWLLLLLFVAAVVAGGWFERERIVAQFPQLADFYALAGVPVTAPGPTLRLSDVTTQSAQVEGDTVITVRGTVSNISDRKQVLPPLRAQLTDSGGTVLVEWTFDPPRSELDAGDSAAFETETRNPPGGAQNLSISLVGGEAATMR